MYKDYQIIDFHTHIFPDKIAAKTIESLSNRANIKAYTNGTLQGLKDSMVRSGVDYSVVLPVCTRPEQFETINNYAASINGINGIISFGGIHPDTDNYKDEIKKIKQLSLKGIKLHPDYQNVFIDDDRYLRIIDEAANNDLIVVIHSGVDVGLPDVVHCTPQRAANVLDKIDYDKIVLAHVGAHGMWDEVVDLLIGRNVYFDLAYSLGKIDYYVLDNIITNHGADRILFATDSPWDGQKEDIDYLIENVPIHEDNLRMIFYQNAQYLLNMK